MRSFHFHRIIPGPLIGPRRSVSEQIRRLIYVKFWAMDIHPSARIAPSALIDRTFPKGIHIHEGVVIDQDAVILTHDLTRGLYLDTTIGAWTLVGAKAMILPGVTVGAYCVIEPGAIVNRNVADGEIVSGSPARALGNARDELSQKVQLGNA